MKSISVLPLIFELGDIKIVVNPTVLQDGQDVVLVDCGYPGFKDYIKEELSKKGLSLSDVTKIIITHSDHDHMGALKAIVDEYPNIEVMASGEQIKYITGTDKSLRLIQAEEAHKHLDEKGKEENLGFMNMIASVEKVNKVTPIKDGDIIPICGGVEVIDTSGHMPGHISLYVKEEKTLIGGDVIDVWDGNLAISMPQFMLDMNQEIKSLEKLLNYDIEKVMTYHGGVFTGEVKDGIKNVIQSYKK